MFKFKNLFLRTPLLILILLFIIYFPTFFSGKSLFYRDLSIHDYPLSLFISKIIKNGEIPLWNPDLLSGFPQLGSTQPPIFYPNIILFLLLPFNIALSLSLIIHYFLAGLGVYMLARFWQIDKTAALAGGVVFSLNGYLFESSNLQYTVYPVAWIPFIFLSVEKLLEKQSLNNFLLFTLYLVLQLATGRIDYFYFTVFFLALWLIFRVIQSGEKKILSLVLLTGGAGLAMIIMAVQILPSMDYIRESFRGEELSYKGATFWSLHPLQLTNLVFNNLWGNPYKQTGIYYLLTDRVNLNFLIYNLYLGSPCLLIAGYSLGRKKVEVYILFFLAVLFTFLSFGHYSPLYSFLFEYFPGFNQLRYPVKLFIFPLFALSLMVAIGLDHLSRKEGLKYIHFASVIFVGFLLLCLIFVYLNSRGILARINDGTANYGLTVKNLTFVYESIIVSVLFLTLFTFFLWKYKSRVISPEAFTLIVMGLISFELMNNNLSNLWLTDFSIMSQKPNVAKIISDSRDNNLYYLLQDTEAKDPSANPDFPKLLWENFVNSSSLSFNFSLVHGIKNAFGYSPSPPIQLFKLITWINDEIPGILVTNDKKAELMRLMGVKYYIWHINNKKTVPPGKDNFNLVNDFPELGIQLWELKNSQPRFTFKTRLVTLKSENEIARVLLGIKEPEIKINEDYLFVTEKEKILNKKISLAGEAKGEIKLLKEKNNTLELELESNKEGFLSLANNYHKGWHAFLNEQEVPVFRANFYQMAIEVPAGKSRIRFIYLPDSFVIGKLISFSGILIYLVLLLVFLFRSLIKRGNN